MKLSDNLKRIRREHNLSQEQLAEKLGVSRQAVSKWESEQSYPEMDKVLLICKLFNYNIDELMNENVKEVDENKQSKVNINKYIEDFFSFITKTVDMISSMSIKQRLKCLAEQFIVGILLATILAMIGGVIYTILEGAIAGMKLGKTIYIIGNLISSLYCILALIVGIAVLLHVFKIRYLDYYEIVKEEVDEEAEEKLEINEKITNEKVEDVKKKIFIEKKKEKVIIRDPKHSESKFLNGILRFILWWIKLTVVFIAIGFIFTFITLITLLVLSFLFVKAGLVFVGSFIGIVSGILVNFVILEICYNFIVSKKSKKNRMAIIILIALILAGLSIGMVCIGVTEFNYIEEAEYTEEKVYEVDMSNNLSISAWRNIEFIETESENVKMVIKHSKYFTPKLSDENENMHIYFETEKTEIMQEIRSTIKDINNKEIRDYYNPKIYVYASKENIEKIKENSQIKYEESQEYKINELENENEKLENETDSLREIINKREEEIETLKQYIQDLERINN